MERRPGQWNRSQAIAAMRRRARAVAGGLARIALAGAFSLVVFAVLLPASIRGYLIGFWIAVVPGAIAFVLLVSSERAFTRLQGVMAERFTADELTARRRRRAGWRVVHGLNLDHHDIDHIAVGPAGVLAIETKWAGGTPWRIERGRLVGPVDDPIAQVQEEARHVRRFLASTTGGPPASVPVRPVLVVWGPGAPDLGEAGSPVVGGVVVIEGPAPSHWTSLLDGGPAMSAELRAAADKVAAYAATQLSASSRAVER